MLDAAFLAALGLLMLRLPTRLMPLLCLWSVPLSISSYTVQALETVRIHVETKPAICIAICVAICIAIWRGPSG